MFGFLFCFQLPRYFGLIRRLLLRVKRSASARNTMGTTGGWIETRPAISLLTLRARLHD